MKYYQACMGLAMVAGLSAYRCEFNPPVVKPKPDPTRQYELSITNLTAGQPFSPLAVIAHSGAYSVFNIGAAASAGLERLAEDGSPVLLLSEADSSAAVYTTERGSDPIAPATSATIGFEVRASQQRDGLTVSIATMLVNTNDAFTGHSGIDIGDLAAGDSLTVNAISYDSGTEANSEAAGTMPGPADGGEGFNAARDDLRDQVTAHGGVVTADDGLSTSVLNQVHRWDNPTSRITVRRVQ